MTIRLHRGDLPDLSRYQSGVVAVDTETMGLDPNRDRLCVVQLSPGDGSADVVQIPPGANNNAPNLTKLLADGTPPARKTGHQPTGQAQFFETNSCAATSSGRLGFPPAPSSMRRW
jgi:hypothetical protein